MYYLLEYTLIRLRNELQRNDLELMSFKLVVVALTRMMEVLYQHKFDLLHPRPAATPMTPPSPVKHHAMRIQIS